MSLNGVVAGCNQKSNRSPIMQLEADQVEESLDRLREFGAVALVEGSGRVQKYRHYLYEWLGVSKVELSVMIELLLRGPQTEGELRGRVSRMDPIDDLNSLRELLTVAEGQGSGDSPYPGRARPGLHARPLSAARFGPPEGPAFAAGRDRRRMLTTRTTSNRVQPPRRVPPPSPLLCAPPLRPAVPEIWICCGRRSRNSDSQARQQQQEIEELGAGFRRMEDEFQDLKRALGG